MLSSFIKNRKDLERSEIHSYALDIVEEGLRSADPKEAIKKSVYLLNNSKLCVNNKVIEIDGRIHVVGFGKASKRMAEGIYEVLNDKIVGGVVITPQDYGVLGSIQIVKGDHPIPKENTLNASKKLIEYLMNNVRENDVVFVLISGGGSALFEVPADGISIDDIAIVSRELMKRGADIVELNAVRKHLSLVKGGGLLRYIKARYIISLIISDVVGDRLDTIASGPTVADETTFRDAYRVLLKYGLWDEIPINIRKRIEKGIQGKIPETVKPYDEILKKVLNVVVASNTISLKAMAKKSEELGFKSMILTPFIEGEAREVGKVLAAIMKSIRYLKAPLEPPVALLAGGETTVFVRGKGVGGRNQELCLSLAIKISDLKNAVAVCLGSDGIDGVSPAAGAIVDGEVVKEAVLQGMDPNKYLEDNDSYSFFSKLKRAIITGYTGTNVNDFFVALIP